METHGIKGPVGPTGPRGPLGTTGPRFERENRPGFLKRILTLIRDLLAGL